MYLLDKNWVVVFSPMVESRKIAHGRITGVAVKYRIV